MDLEWNMTDDPLAEIRTEALRARPEERGRLLKPLAQLHAATLGKPSLIDVDRFVETAISLTSQASLFERMAFANMMADIGRIPPALLDVMLSDVYLVSRPLVERADLSDDHLLAVMADDASESTLLLIAQRAETGIPVTDRIVERGTLKVHLTLAANDRAALSMSTFVRFSSMTEAQNDMDLALAKRSDLPVSIAKTLYQRISARAEKRVAEMIERDRNRGRRVLSLGR